MANMPNAKISSFLVEDNVTVSESLDIETAKTLEQTVTHSAMKSLETTHVTQVEVKCVQWATSTLPAAALNVRQEKRTKIDYTTI